MEDQEQQLAQPLLNGNGNAQRDEDVGADAAKIAEAQKHLQPMSVSGGDIFKTWVAQGKMAWPIVVQLMSMYGLSVISLSFVGHIGKKELAAAALGTSFTNMVGRMVIMGLNGALDTLASQAAGSGDITALPTLFYRSILFEWLHAIPLTAGLLCIPKLMSWQGSDDELVTLAYQFLLLLIPNLWLDCIARPLNSVLVAQRITWPQTLVALLTVPAHIGTNYLFIHKLNFGFTGAAIATCCSTLYSIILIFIILLVCGMTHKVVGSFTPRVMRGWGAHAALAYPACFMRCAESLGFTLVTLTSAMLPDPSTAVSAASVAFNIYGILYMPFAAFSITTVAFVGNALGTGDPRAARVSAIASILAAPCMWVIIATLLLEPHTQQFLVLLFTDGSDVELMHHLKLLLYIVAMLELFDGTQTIMSGIITGCGRQKLGAVINLVSFYGLAIPAAQLMGFYFKKGVEGMYMGMALGPLAQMMSFGAFVIRVNWMKEANKAQERISAAC